MPDLSTTYLGMQLPNPFVPSASPLSRNVDTIRRMEDAGAAAVVLHSLFEEQITFESHVLDKYLTGGADSFWEALTYYPEPEAFALPPEQYLEHVRGAKSAVDIPIIGSLNGVSTGGWIKYARMIEEAGADALELNVYFVPSDPRLVGAQIEQATIDLVREVRRSVHLPLAVKLSPFYSNGVDRLRDIRRDLEAWLVEREYESVKQLRGSMSHRKVAEPAAFERAQYVRTVGTFSLGSTLAYEYNSATYGMEASGMRPAD
jgi:dihydroorotate dehydrogenase (fumarate)